MFHTLLLIFKEKNRKIVDNSFTQDKKLLDLFASVIR